MIQKPQKFQIGNQKYWVNFPKVQNAGLHKQANLALNIIKKFNKISKFIKYDFMEQRTGNLEIKNDVLYWPGVEHATNQNFFSKF